MAVWNECEQESAYKLEDALKRIEYLENRIISDEVKKPTDRYVIQDNVTKDYFEKFIFETICWTHDLDKAFKLYGGEEATNVLTTILKDMGYISARYEIRLL
jgi:hypothetical protein